MLKVSFKQLILTLLLFNIVGCTDTLNKSIKQFELSTNKEKVISIEITEPASVFLSRDSIEIIDQILENKLSTISTQLKQEEKALLDARNEFKDIKSEELKRIYNKQLNRMEMRIIRLQKINNLYKESPEKTGLANLMHIKNEYRQQPMDTLGFVLEAEIKSKTGKLKPRIIKRNYLLDKSQEKVLALLK